MFNEIKDIVSRYYPQTNYWHDLKSDFSVAESVMDEAFEQHVDELTDDIWCDIETMVTDWIDRHGEYTADRMAVDIKRMLGKANSY